MQTITQKTLSDSIYDQRELLLTYTIHYPSFTTTCREDAARQINESYALSAREAADYCQMNLSVQASEDADYARNNNFPFHGYEVVSGYTITYNSDCITSLFTDWYTYMGGAHGTTLRTSDTWDFQSGRKLTLGDFYPHNPAYRESILKNLERQVKERLQTSPSAYFDDYVSLLQSGFKPENFYMTPEGIVIYYQQYEIAPYSTGIPEFLLPFRKNR